ncbi:hypothetical protein L3i22_039950 [Actinoplanes sp. L3-i22]|nr:hypothetical protein L3i22_039950 [Actinoplanes sp. L3-i22]
MRISVAELMFVLGLAYEIVRSADVAPGVPVPPAAAVVAGSRSWWLRRRKDPDS